MQTITLNKKKYVILEQKQFEKIQMMAARKVPPEKEYSLAEGRRRAHKLIDKWVKESKK